MQKHVGMFFIGLLIASLSQPLFFANPARSQGATLASNSSGTRYGMNAEPPCYTEMAYTDVCMEAWWGGNLSSFTANGYPNIPNSNVQLFLSVAGDSTASNIYNFYGEGIFDVVNAYGYVQGSKKTYINSKGVQVLTCQFQLGKPAPSAGGYNSAQSIPLNWIDITVINPTSDPKNWPNNFHLIRPGYPAWQEGDSFYPVTATSFPIFTNEFLKSFAPFCCIRFMDWMNTNNNSGLTWTPSGVINNGPFSWAQRPKLNYFQSSPESNSSVAYENMIALCNATNCDMWLNVPLQATDDWKVGMANLIANDPTYHLNSNLHVYYEHSNEMWNWGFLAWSLVDQLAQQDFGSDGLGAWFEHGEEMGKLLMSDVVVMQPIFSAVSSNFGRPIAAGQVGDPNDYCGGMLYYIQNSFGPPKNFIYAIAGAPYFGSDPNEFNTYDLSTMQANMTLANKYSIKFCAYEGGQGLPSTPQSTFDTNFAYQTTPAMATQYYNFANMWQQNGGDLHNFFNNSGVWSQFGYWAHLPLGSYIDNLSDPVCTRYVAAATIASVCNCGNAVPPPPPPAPPPPPPPAPTPPPPSTNTSGTGAGTGTPTSQGAKPTQTAHPYNWSPGGFPTSK